MFHKPFIHFLSFPKSYPQQFSSIFRIFHDKPTIRMGFPQINPAFWGTPVPPRAQLGQHRPGEDSSPLWLSDWKRLVKIIRVYTGLYGFIRVYMALHGFIWLYTGLYGFIWVYMGMPNIYVENW